MNTKVDKAFLRQIARRQPQIIDRLRQLVEIESPSGDRAAINRAVTLVAAWCKELGGRVVRHARPAKNGIPEHGDILEARFEPAQKSKAKPVMILGHLDTVWPLGTLAQMPFKQSGGKLFGPGVLDMKAGVVMALEAIASLPLTRPVVLLLTSDEEIGSHASRPLIESLARKCDAVYVLEPAQGLAYKTARKGVGEYGLHVTGIASHSGVDFEKGHSAILELARQLEKIAGFSNPRTGITVNPGVIRGGTRSNVIAAEASAEIDIRVAKLAQEKVLDKKFRALKPIDKHCKLTLTGGLNRPPMERSVGTVALYRRAKKFAAPLGLELHEAATGGGSDGNFTAGIGIATLDGMGAIGLGAHARHEHIELKHLAIRIALIAAMLQA